MVSLGHATLVATAFQCKPIAQSFGIRDYVSELSVVAVQELREKNSRVYKRIRGIRHHEALSLENLQTLGS